MKNTVGKGANTVFCITMGFRSGSDSTSLVLYLT